jgi:hypothetical protein
MIVTAVTAATAVTGVTCCNNRHRASLAVTHPPLYPPGYTGDGVTVK